MLCVRKGDEVIVYVSAYCLDNFPPSSLRVHEPSYNLVCRWSSWRTGKLQKAVRLSNLT